VPVKEVNGQNIEQFSSDARLCGECAHVATKGVVLAFHENKNRKARQRGRGTRHQITTGREPKKNLYKRSDKSSRGECTLVQPVSISDNIFLSFLNTRSSPAGLTSDHRSTLRLSTRELIFHRMLLLHGSRWPVRKLRGTMNYEWVTCQTASPGSDHSFCPHSPLFFPLRLRAVSQGLACQCVGFYIPTSYHRGSFDSGNIKTPCEKDTPSIL
jgi:hypothetical protein